MDFGLCTDRTPWNLNKIQGPHCRQLSQFIFTKFRNAIAQIINAGQRPCRSLPYDRSSRLFTETLYVSQAQPQGERMARHGDKSIRHLTIDSHFCVSPSPCLSLSASISLRFSQSLCLRAFSLRLERAQPIRASDIYGENF